MTSWTYLAQSIPWAIAGLIVGWLMGRSTVAVETIAEAVQEEGDPVAEQPPAPKRRRVRFRSNVIFGVVLLVLGAFTIVQSYVQNAATEQQSAATERLAVCTRAYADGFADALEERSAAASAAQDALDELIDKISAASQTDRGRAQVRAALADYKTKRAESKRTRQDNPYPAPPRDICNE